MRDHHRYLGKVSSSVPRVMNGTGVVTGMSGGGIHSLLTTATGRVLSFGTNDGGVWEALTPLVVDGLTVGGVWEGVAEEISEGKEGKE